MTDLCAIYCGVIPKVCQTKSIQFFPVSKFDAISNCAPIAMHLQTQSAGVFHHVVLDICSARTLYRSLIVQMILI